MLEHRNISNPFGMVMPGRNGGSGYRYGFNGMEMDDEIKGTGNSINFKYRMYDPRIGRFFVVDPLAADFAYMTPYQFAGNKPVWSKELEGLQSEVDKPVQAPSGMDEDELFDNYDKEGQQILRDVKILNHLKDKDPPENTCAIRMSDCFNESGYSIPTANETPNNVRVQSGNLLGREDPNFILDAPSFGNYLNTLESPTYSFSAEELSTEEGIKSAIQKVHASDNLEGIIVISAGNRAAYGAAGHVDLIYEDFMWDLSMYSYDNGKDLQPYLIEKNVNAKISAQLSIQIWVIDEDW